MKNPKLPKSKISKLLSQMRGEPSVDWQKDLKNEIHSQNSASGASVASTGFVDILGGVRNFKDLMGKGAAMLLGISFPFTVYLISLLIGTFAIVVLLDPFNYGGTDSVMVASNTTLQIERGEAWVNGERGIDGQILTEGDQIKVEADSLATIAYFDDSVSRLNSDTEVSLKTLDSTNYHQGESAVTLRLEDGEVYSKVPKQLSPDVEFNIETGNINTTVLGSAFNVERNGNKMIVTAAEHTTKIALSEIKNQKIIKNNEVVYEKIERLELIEGEMAEIDIYKENVEVKPFINSKWLQENETKDDDYLSALEQKQLKMSQERAGALPGSFGYKIKGIQDKLDLAFAGEDRVKVELAIAERELVEATLLLTEGQEEAAKLALSRATETLKANLDLGEVKEAIFQPKLFLRQALPNDPTYLVKSELNELTVALKGESREIKDWAKYKEVIDIYDYHQKNQELAKTEVVYEKLRDTKKPAAKLELEQDPYIEKIFGTKQDIAGAKEQREQEQFNLTSKPENNKSIIEAQQLSREVLNEIPAPQARQQEKLIQKTKASEINETKKTENKPKSATNSNQQEVENIKFQEQIDNSSKNKEKEDVAGEVDSRLEAPSSKSKKREQMSQKELPISTQKQVEIRGNKQNTSSKGENNEEVSNQQDLEVNLASSEEEQNTNQSGDQEEKTKTNAIPEVFQQQKAKSSKSSSNSSGRANNQVANPVVGSDDDDNEADDPEQGSDDDDNEADDSEQGSDDDDNDDQNAYSNSLQACIVLIDRQGEIITDPRGVVAQITLHDEEQDLELVKTISFANYSLNTDKFYNDGILDTYCAGFELPSGVQHVHYSDLSITAEHPVVKALYNDQYNMQVSSLGNFYEYQKSGTGEKGNHDGHITYTFSRRDRELFVLAELNTDREEETAEDLPEDSGSTTTDPAAEDDTNAEDDQAEEPTESNDNSDSQAPSEDAAQDQPVEDNTDPVVEDQSPQEPEVETDPAQDPEADNPANDQSENTQDPEQEVVEPTTGVELEIVAGYFEEAQVCKGDNPVAIIKVKNNSLNTSPFTNCAALENKAIRWGNNGSLQAIEPGATGTCRIVINGSHSIATIGNHEMTLGVNDVSYGGGSTQEADKSNNTIVTNFEIIDCTASEAQAAPEESLSSIPTENQSPTQDQNQSNNEATETTTEEAATSAPEAAETNTPEQQTSTEESTTNTPTETHQPGATLPENANTPEHAQAIPEKANKPENPGKSKN